MGKYIYDVILTPEEDGSYNAEVPNLPGCFSCGDSYEEAVFMAADAARTWVSAQLAAGEIIPDYSRAKAPKGSERIAVFFEAEPSWIVEGPYVSAAQAARDLGVTPARVTHMLAAGQLEGYREGRRTYITVKSVEERKSMEHPAGRPRKAAV